MKILLVYPPFCTPASPPYSLTNLHSFLKNNSTAEIVTLDLNIQFHNLKFPSFKEYFQSDWRDLKCYSIKSKEYCQLSAQAYSENNKKVLAGTKPEYFAELLEKIKIEKPDIVAFSFVYSSQAFYGLALLKELNITTVIGGPCINDKLKKMADHHFANEVEFLHFIQDKCNLVKTSMNDLNIKYSLDYSIYPLNKYFVPKIVLPLKTSSTCYYKQCAFCNHYSNVSYFEYDLELIKKTITNSQCKHFFLIDDMIPAGRLLKLADLFKQLNIKWACQLKPSTFSDSVMKTLYDSGLRIVIWGAESGNQRILDLMKKGTKLEEIRSTLKNSHAAGIKNVVYIMFGFPTETEEEFKDTISFLKDNAENIDLISESTFGLQKGTPIYNNPDAFGITKIEETKRTILEPKIEFESKGLSRSEIVALKKKFKQDLEKINKYPRNMNFFREHMLTVN
ncbi:B12-binding domain-containing radical SAM protein [Nanoarchaeota archaeon]